MSMKVGLLAGALVRQGSSAVRLTTATTTTTGTGRSGSR